MYVTGNYRDTVTRYNHKDQSRWMKPSHTYWQSTRGEIESCIIIALSVAVLIVVGVMLLQAV